MEDLGNVCRDFVAAIVIVLVIAFLAHCLAEFMTPCLPGAMC